MFVEGRYRKICRDLPQTVFFCPDCKGHPRRRRGCERCEGFGKLTRDSVQELIGWVAGKAFGTRKNKFHGAAPLFQTPHPRWIEMLAKEKWPKLAGSEGASIG